MEDDRDNLCPHPTIKSICNQHKCTINLGLRGTRYRQRAPTLGSTCSMCSFCACLRRAPHGPLFVAISVRHQPRTATIHKTQPLPITLTLPLSYHHRVSICASSCVRTSYASWATKFGHDLSGSCSAHKVRTIILSAICPARSTTLSYRSISSRI